MPISIKGRHSECRDQHFVRRYSHRRWKERVAIDIEKGKPPLDDLLDQSKNFMKRLRTIWCFLRLPVATLHWGGRMFPAAGVGSLQPGPSSLAGSRMHVVRRRRS